MKDEEKSQYDRLIESAKQTDIRPKEKDWGYYEECPHCKLLIDTVIKEFKCLCEEDL